MATGKELVRMVTCNVYKKYVESKEYFVSLQIIDNNGNVVTLQQASKLCFCHARILINSKNLSDDYVELLGTMLKIIASTSSEFMSLNIHKCYNYSEIIIS